MTIKGIGLCALYIISCINNIEIEKCSHGTNLGLTEQQESSFQISLDDNDESPHKVHMRPFLIFHFIFSRSKKITLPGVHGVLT